MIKEQQAKQLLDQLHLQYPNAFKRNYLFYSMLKTKGLLDELKEFVPWILAAMIFVSFSLYFSSLLSMQWPEMSAFRAYGISVLGIMLFFMLICPIIIKQIKHSSTSLYTQLRNTPMKLALLIVLQAINIAFIENYFLQSVLFFFALSFGFVKFYKENLFRADAGLSAYYYLEEIRRICFWSYKQTAKHRLLLCLTKNSSPRQQQLKLKIQRLNELHEQMLRFEHQLCKSVKHLTVDTYLDEISDE